MAGNGIKGTDRELALRYTFLVGYIAANPQRSSELLTALDRGISFDAAQIAVDIRGSRQRTTEPCHCGGFTAACPVCDGTGEAPKARAA